MFSHPGNSNDTKLYDLLSLNKSASESDIKKAYRKAAMKWHPDRWSNKSDSDKKQAENKFKEIGEAYAILSDPQKRSMYDKYGMDAVKGAGGGGGNPFDIFEQMFGGGNPFGGGDSPFGGMGPFASMFGGRHQNERRDKGPDKKIQVNITMKECLLGCNKNIIIEKNNKCIPCDGSGANKGNKSYIQTCSQCGGKGMVMRVIQLGPGMIQQQSSVCPKCNGKCKNIIPGKECKYCKGKGFKLEKMKKEIHIVKGTKRGDHIKLEEMADYTPNSERPGDLYVVFNELEDKEFKRQGNNILYTKSILLSEALTGLEFILLHPSGESIRVSYNNVIKPNDVKVLTGMGYPSSSSIVKGDLIIKFDIKFPMNLDSKRKEILYKVLPKNTKIPFDKSLRECYLEDYSNSNTYDSDSDDQPGEGSVQCPTQ